MKKEFKGALPQQPSLPLPSSEGSASAQKACTVASLSERRLEKFQERIALEAAAYRVHSS